MIRIDMSDTIYYTKTLIASKYDDCVNDDCVCGGFKLSKGRPYSRLSHVVNIHESDTAHVSKSVHKKSAAIMFSIPIL